MRIPRAQLEFLFRLGGWTFLAIFVCMLSIGAMRKGPAKPWSEVVGLSVAIAASIVTLVVIAVERDRRDRIRLAAFRSALVSGNAAGSVILDARGYPTEAGAQPGPTTPG